MRLLNFRDFMKEKFAKWYYDWEWFTKSLYFFYISQRFKRYSDKAFNIDNGSMGGSYWTYFIIKDNKSFYFDSFGGQLDKFLVNQLPKPIIYHKYKIQDINSRLCDSYCLNFFSLIERMNHYDAILKKYFDAINAN